MEAKPSMEGVKSVPLLEGEVDPDPIVQFERWFQEAKHVGISEANAMCLATATPDGQPSARYVLLHGVGPSGFVWYTNYLSRKSAELESNPRAALVFWWKEVSRSVRIEGDVTRLSPEESDAYFQSRPRNSQLSAVASSQSSPIGSREELHAKKDLVAESYSDPSVPIVCPEHWGGFRLSPRKIEFWKSQDGRLHDRLCYEKQGETACWTITRLQP